MILYIIWCPDDSQDRKEIRRNDSFLEQRLLCSSDNIHSRKRKREGGRATNQIKVKIEVENNKVKNNEVKNNELKDPLSFLSLHFLAVLTPKNL